MLRGTANTLNINAEMNYWPAEVTNLSETHQPLFDMITDLSKTESRWLRLRAIRRKRMGCPSQHRIYGALAVLLMPLRSMWPNGGAWLATHLWQHYLYTGDKEFLKKY